MFIEKDEELHLDGKRLDDLDDKSIDEAVKGAVEGEEDDTPDDSSSSKKDIKDEKEKPSHQGEDIDDENKDVPFHKHPRFRELINKNKELTENFNEALNTINELKASFNNKKEDSEEMAGWFKELYGDSEEVKTAWKIYNQQTLQERERVKREILAEFESKEIKAKQEDEKWNNWVNNEVERLEDEGENFDRNKLLKIMKDYRPTTEDGSSLDFNKGLDLYKKIYNNDNADDKNKNTIKKKIADTTTDSTKNNKNEHPFLTQKELRHKSFLSLTEDNE